MVTSIGVEEFYDSAYYNYESNWENDILYIGNYLIKANTSISGGYTMKDGTLDGTLCVVDEAFHYCTDLTSITMQNSVTSIGWSAFNNCISLTDVYYGGRVAEWNSISIGSNNSDLLNATIHCTDGDTIGQDTSTDTDTDTNTNTDTSNTDTQNEGTTDSTGTADGTGLGTGTGTNTGSLSGTTTDASTSGTLGGASNSSLVSSTSDTATTTVSTSSASTPKKITLKKTTSPKKKQMKVIWNKKANVTGYQVQYVTNKKFTKNKKPLQLKVQR
ncbi:MAG: leucine-rich repeat domain-containing protein, partial [Clostridiales bacterium]|nr:leucine-rich repeat domain-containing protein [Clostridiales bacterium]